ncbi:hypothetical protein PYW07_005257 [Mythimna separata]|uniref:Uncharacterized protein n=1 Tax=Mythimna separata TaxID=271217 RepID=A0AAD8DNK6_MYTSE|nr:hypothetical protein PYW07_005257 [Mythimna separata]
MASNVEQDAALALLQLGSIGGPAGQEESGAPWTPKPQTSSHDPDVQRADSGSDPEGNLSKQRSPSAQDPIDQVKETEDYILLVDTEKMDKLQNHYYDLKSNLHALTPHLNQGETSPTEIEDILELFRAVTHCLEQMNITEESSVEQQESPTVEAEREHNALQVRETPAQTANSDDMIPIGKGHAKVPADVLIKVDWDSYTKATRTLLLAIFPRRNCITVACADEAKMYLKRQMKHQTSEPP